MKQILICFLMLSKFLGYSQTQIACDRSSDSLELVKFYQNFNGNQWNIRTNWLIPGKPISTWSGILLNASGCVEEINLDSNKLNGVIFDYNFPNLRKLNIDYNKIRGTIPDFTKLSELNILNLAHNELTGSIPNFFSLAKMTNLELANNLLNGSIPDFNRLLSLKVINFSNNQLTGEIPNFTRLSKLTDLDLGYNLLTGAIPDFSNTPNLVLLVVHANNLSGNIPNFSNVPKLIWFLTAYNKLTGPIPNFSKTPELFQLILAVNQLTGSIPDFNKIPKLQYLLVSNNNLEGPIPDFSNLPKVWTMNFSFNQLTGPIPNFKNMPELYRLKLAGNKFTGTIPDFKLTTPQIKELDVYENDLTGPIPDFSSYNIFYCWNNKFTFSDILSSNNLGAGNFFYYSPQKLFFKDTIFRIAKNTPFQIDLGIDAGLNDNFYFWYKDKFFWNPPTGNNINSNKLVFQNPQASDAGRYASAVQNNNVINLILNSHSISLRVCDEQKDSTELVKLYNSTDGPNWKNSSNWLQAGKRINTWYGVSADQFGCVQKLDLTNNLLKGSLPTLEMNTLDTLILNRNSITGQLPELKIPFIRVLEINNNTLSGNFPKNLNNWTDLRGLDMAFNGITGAVPPDMGDLCELNTLKINNNKIKGELPEQLTMLVKLQKGQVNFSNNQIDSLKDKLIWFCPFGDTILQINPSYDRFLGICNVQCNGNEFNSSKDFPWIADTIRNLNCNNNQCLLTTVHAGYVNVRGIQVFYTLSRCYKTLSPPPVFSDVVKYYDCGGHLIEEVQNSVDSFHSSFGAITKMDFDGLNYEIHWECGQSLDFSTSIEDPIDPANSNKHSSSQIFELQCTPNPAHDFVKCNFVNTEDLNTLRIFNLLGQSYKLNVHETNNQKLLDLSHLPKGIYFISTFDKNKRQLGKVILE